MNDERFSLIEHEGKYWIIDAFALQRNVDDFDSMEDFEEYCIENSLDSHEIVNLLNTLFNNLNTEYVLNG